MSKGISLTETEAKLCSDIFDYIERTDVPDAEHADAGLVVAVLLGGMIMASVDGDRVLAQEKVDMIVKLLRDHIEWLHEMGPKDTKETLQ